MSPKREYTGEAIDATITHLSELDEPGGPKSQTGTETVSFDSETSLQEKIAELDLLNPEIGVRQIARELDTDPSYVSEVLNRTSKDIYGRYRKEKWSDYPKTYREIIKLERAGVYDTRSKIADEVGVSGALVTKVLEANEHIVSR